MATFGARVFSMGAVWRWLLIAAIACQLVLAHGCHGDEDHELFVVIRHLTH